MNSRESHRYVHPEDKWISTIDAMQKTNSNLGKNDSMWILPKLVVKQQTNGFLSKYSCFSYITSKSSKPNEPRICLSKIREKCNCWVYNVRFATFRVYDLH